MNKIFYIFTLVLLASCGRIDKTGQEPQTVTAPQTSSVDSAALARWEATAARVTIIRDNWGVPHIYGKTDADTVFGLLYAQAEDDFNRIEVNYMNAMGRLAEAEGEDKIFQDLRMRLFIEEGEMKRLYGESPPWLKKLMDAYADGLNYFLYKNPQVKARAITRFEPWMALSFSEGSIGGDIERVDIAELENFYGDNPTHRVSSTSYDSDMEPRGSNGYAIAPSKTKNGKALLYINPHTSFYFREEAHMVSEEGLNAYGALTWGQFFVYQGFNENNGWMHTSTYADNIDEYFETVIKNNGKYFYQYDDEQKPFREEVVTIKYKTEKGMASRNFTVYHTHRGPVIRREADGAWISVQLMNNPLVALNQSYMRTKTSSYKAFYEMMRLKANSSNNTVYADADGNIAYFHGNFHPIRDTQFNYNLPVDGSDPRTDWQGLHKVEESIHSLNPGSGWLYNSNNWPFSLAGEGYSPKKVDYPAYMSVNFENPRGVHSLNLYPSINDFTIDSLIAAGYDPHLPGLTRYIPKLVEAQATTPSPALQEAVDLLNAWDGNSGFDSVETSLAMHWGNELWALLPPRVRRDTLTYDRYLYLEKELSSEQYLSALNKAIEKMKADFGTWKIAWGEINRYQRNEGKIRQQFDDSKPSFAMKLASGRWGALASVGSRQYEGTKKWYGTSGNSFIAAVEFGDKVRAKALTAGGLSSDPNSPHFDDQAEMYGIGTFRDVNFYREDVEKNAKRTYHPGN